MKPIGPLMREHTYARAEVRALLEAKNRYAAGESESLEDLKRILDTLIGFYPRHIEKEDKHFFFPTQEYFSKAEQEVLFQEFEDFDAKMIHEKYSDVIERVEGG
jgi:hemerythrin-like domain-containing protein